MNIFNNTLFSNKNVLLGIMLVECFCFISCKDELENSTSSTNQITFTSTIESSESAHTRNYRDNVPSTNTIDMLDGFATPLYLHTEYIDSIEKPLPCQEKGRELSRAIPVSTTNLYNEISLSAYTYLNNFDANSAPNYFYNKTASKGNSNIFTLKETYYWPGKNYKMKFIAYAPVNNPSYTLITNQSPKLNVTIPLKNSEQKDLLVSATNELSGNQNSNVVLNFKHALTAIKFVSGTDMQDVTIKNVEFLNIFSKGQYDINKEQWISYSEPLNYSLDLAKKTTGENQNITSTEQTFMLLPQTLKNASLKVTLEFQGQTSTLTADLNGKVWPMGKTIVYRISNKSINWTYHLEVTGGDITTDHQGGEKSFTIKSYKESTNSKVEPVEWIAEFSTDGGKNYTANSPEWLPNFKVNGSGSQSGENVKFNISEQIGSDKHTDALRNESFKGEENKPYNLSNPTGDVNVMNTANCYVINGPGVYRFPLVYGNAIKEGQTNSKAYKSKLSNSLVLDNFVNHNAQAITSPYLKNNNVTPQKAELLWQDERNLVSNIRLQDDFIIFNVDKQTIKQGNALIAVKDNSNNILWSWHIWVTDVKLNDNPIRVYNNLNVHYDFLPVTLGWCEGVETIFHERECKVKIKSGNKEAILTITQNRYSVTTASNHTYYQWGRKDPFLPSDGKGDTNKKWYDKDGKEKTDGPAFENLTTNKQALANYTKMPMKMQSIENGGHEYNNLWSTDNDFFIATDDIGYKTVYDPCPIGYKVPAGNSFTGFTKGGKLGSIYNGDINGTWNNNGWNFRTDKNTTNTIFFLASGSRAFENNGNLMGVGESGLSLTSSPLKEGRNYCLNFVKIAVDPKYDLSGRANAGSVHPVKEVKGLN